MTYYGINEIFYSVQGEGQWAGTPMVFIRFAGCNLACPWCDTDHRKATRMTLDEIVHRVAEADEGAALSAICFTGGEPTLQLDVPLIAAFDRRPLHIETNGTLPIPAFRDFRCITISPKSAEIPLAIRKMMNCATTNTELKIVFDLSDRDRLEAIIEAWTFLPFGRFFIQPMDFGEGKTNIEAAIDYVKTHPWWSLSVQLHKMLKVR